jgi:hypothetical protein
MGSEGPPSFHQTLGKDQRLQRRQRRLGDRLDANTAIRQRPSKSVTWPRLTRAP